VSQRTKEIGIRLALGAQPSRVLTQTLWQGAKLVALGLVVGTIGAVWLGQLASGLLYGVTATNPGVFALVLALLSGVALIACVIPSRRATQISAVTALRHE
jgi:ABC-type antimicrobial peptide transport system permease subunit